MGNWNSRRKSTGTEDPSGTRKARKKSPSEPDENSQDKFLSCPDLGGAVPYQYQDDNKVNVTVYRSYGNLERAKSGSMREDNKLDIKIYRRSTGGIPKSKSATLPRNFRDNYYSGRVSSPPGLYPELRRSRDTVDSGSDQHGSSRRASATGAERYTFRRAPVSTTDLPTTAQIKQRLAVFEEQFTESLVKKYSQLSDTLQVSALSIAIRKGSTGCQTVSLLDYFSGSSIPEDLLDVRNGNETYTLTIPRALLHGIMHVRRDKRSNMSLWVSLAGDVVTCIGMEAANEIARIYEYQIAMAAESSSIRVMGEHAADCVVEYIKSNNAFLDRNTAILGVLYGRPFKDITRPRLISVIIGERELKWDLFDIFKNAGLRRDVYLVQDDVLQAKDEDLETTRSSNEDDESLPWKYYIASNSDPLLYGYRGQALEWHFVNAVYNLHAEDEDRFTRLMTYHPEDFHKMYMPYRRLVGLGVMQNYCQQASTAEGGASRKGLNEFVMIPQDGASGRDEVQAVYRPLHQAGDSLELRNTVVRNADLTRLQLDEAAELNQASLRNTRLLLAEVDSPTVRKADLGGADLSYSTVTDSDHRDLQQQGATVKHVAFVDTTTTREGAPQSRTRNAKRAKAEGKTAISGSEGKIVELEEVIVIHQKRIEEVAARKAVEEAEAAARKADEEAKALARRAAREAKAAARKAEEEAKPKTPPSSPDVPPETTTTVTTTTTAVTKSAAAKKIKKIKKKKDKKQKKKTPSIGSGSASPATSPDGSVGSDPRLNVSADFHQPINGEVNGEVIQAVSAKPQFAEAPVRASTSGVPVYQSSPRQGQKSLSATNVNLAELRPGRAHRQHISDRTTFPRMTKSMSHHGKLSEGHSGDLGFYTGSRRVMSQVEIEFIRKSQVFRMIQGLQIDNMESNLPAVCSPFLGRQQETEDLVELLGSPGKVVCITGCPGIGKSSLALSAAHLMTNNYVLPIVVDAKDARNTYSIFKRIVSTFNLHFKMSEIDMFYKWVNCHEQRPLLVLDNMDFPLSEAQQVSELLDKLVQNIKNLRILCTSQRKFYRGSTDCELYELGSINQNSEDLLRQLTPDLHDEGIRELADVCGHVPFAMITVAKTLAAADIDSGKLFEDLTLNQNGKVLQPNQEEMVSSMVENDSDKKRLSKVACCVQKVVDTLPAETAKVLVQMSHVPHSFDVVTIVELTGMNTDRVIEGVDELNKAGLIYNLRNTQRYCMPQVVRMIAQTSDADPSTSASKQAKHFLKVLASICSQYHSKSCEEGLKLFDADYDNIIEVLRHIVEEGQVYEQCRHFGKMEYVILLNAMLPCHLFKELYTSLHTQATSSGDPSAQCSAHCALSYFYVANKEYEAAKLSADQAYELMQSGGDEVATERAFCLQCMARVGWHTSEERQDKERAMVLAKRALEVFKFTLGVRSVSTLYANELYAWMLMQFESYQAARHYYNVSDVLVRELLDEHPALLHGYDCRRIIWDDLFLFARATETAKKAADVATKYYGDHPLTGTMTLHLCQSIIKRGSLNDAIEASVRALRIRIKTLGDHIDTALAYKTLAYLMLRSGQYDEAVRFSQNALEIYEMDSDSTERMKIDVKNISAQARYRLECRSSVFVELESKDASKPNVAEENHVTNISFAGSAVSTEV